MSTDGEGETTSPSWIFWAMANVFGGLRSVVDFMWKWGQVPGGTIPMDTLNTLLLGWLAFGLLIIVLAKFLYDKFLSWDQSEDEENEFVQQEVNETQKSPDEGGVTPLPPLAVPIITRKATIVPESLPEHISAPIATGGDPDAVRWVNNILVWFYEGSEGGYIVRNSWNDGLNEYTVGSALETGVLIEILEFLPQCPAPSLTNIIVDCAPNDDITVTCDMTATLYLRIQTTRTQHDVTTESEYACAVRPLRGRLNIAVQTHQCVGFLKFDGWPEINMELEGVRNNTEGLDEEQLQEVLREELTSALRKVALELDFLSRKTFPRFSRERSLPENVIPVGYDALQPTPQPVQLTSPVGIVGLNGKRLLVKVVKATGVGGDAGVSSCYVVIEMDDPPQKFSTNVVRDSSSPFWDEQFLFDLSDNTLELLFELYDKADNRFVGLGIVGIEELVATPSQRQIIPLQARPYEKDEVTGSLTCEFLFLDRADLPDLTLRKTTTGQTASGKLKTTTYIKPSEEKQPEEEIITSTAGVAETALKDLEGRQGSAPLAPNTRSTLIIHASRKDFARRKIKVTRTPSGEYEELANGNQGVEEQYYEEEEDTDYKPGVSADLGSGVMAPTGSGTGTPHRSLGASDSTVPQVGSGSRNSASPSDISRSDNTPSQVPSSPNGLPPDDRGRSRSRRTRDFFGSLRRRFSRSKLRSKSVEPTAVDTLDDRDPLSGRSVSMERAAYGRSRGTLTVPTIMRGRTSPTGGGLGSGDSGSTRSSLSGTSGISSTSTKTYINEASLLVVETLENGVVKHYLVPLSLQRKNKWRKKGTKLHIYNEHTFVAKHLSSSVTCQVCQKGVGRRLGKQGYECRDCSFKCHKPCHVKADIVCPNSTVNSMDLVYVKDERAEKRKRLLSS